MGRPAFQAFFVLGQIVGPGQTGISPIELETKRKMLQDVVRHRLLNLGKRTARMHQVKDACSQIRIVQHPPVLQRTKHMRM